MSKVEELLAKYNPNGVFQSDLREVSSIIRGKRVTKRDVKERGDYPVISGGESPMGYYDTFNREANTITIAQYGAAGYVDFQKNKFWANDVCYSILPFESVDNKYLYYTLKSKQNFIYSIRNTDAVPFSLPINTLYSIQIPLPHIKVQEEIVKILDSFTNLIDALNEELSLRQKQFEYYREKLLTFDDDVEKFIVTEVAQLKSGLTYKPSDVSDKGILVLRSSNIKNGFLSYDDNVFVKESTKISDRSIVRCNDILICVRNGSKKLVGKCAMIDKNADGMAFGAFMSVLRAKDINPKYLFYVWSSQIIQDKIKGDDAAPINQITSKDFNRLLIPVPKEQIQKSIVEKLDAFESLISSLKEEIALRQKQYEYYREKLLNFN